MKSILPLLAVLWPLAGLCAPTVSMAWNPSPDADVTNYRLYWGPGSGNYSGSTDLGNVTNTVFTRLTNGGHYWFVVTAINAGGAQSDPSNEIDYQVPSKPGPPQELRIIATIETSSNLVTWSPAAITELRAAVGAQSFYRAKLQAVPLTPPAPPLPPPLR